MFVKNVSQLSLHCSGSARDCRGVIVQLMGLLAPLAPSPAQQLSPTCEILIVIVPCILWV